MEIQSKEINEKVQVIHRGIYINNERRKGRGGRIRSSSIDLKIQVMDGDAALHESEVEWVEVRRYIKQKQNGKKKTEQKMKETKQQQKMKETKKQQKQKKYKPKQQVIQENSKKKKYKQKINTEQNPHGQMKNQHPISPESAKRKENKQINQDIQKTEEETVEITQNKMLQQNQSPKRQGDGEGQESDEETEVVVAEVIKQIKIVYKDKPFVGLFAFRDKNKNKNLKYRSKDQELNLLQILSADKQFQIYPNHRRLHVMVVKQPLKYSTIFNKYINQNLHFEPQTKRGSKLNLIIDLLQNVYVLCRFSHWEKNYPVAQIIKILGPVNTIQGQCSSMLHEYGLNDFQHNLNEDTMDQIVTLNPSPFHKPINIMVFTIDPKTACDLDDALSIQHLEGDLFEIGIHIADVSSYLGMVSRQQLLKRTTSVYLPHKVYHMLPSKILKICSLDPNEERLAFSIFVKMNKKGQLIDSRLEKNILKSRFKLSYETYQDFITGTINQSKFNQIHKCSTEQYIALSQKLLDLEVIATAHRSKRIVFDIFQNKEVQFQIDSQNWPINVTIQKRITAKKVIEEYMIIGNVEAAKKLVKVSPEIALVIHHPAPTQQSVTYFNDCFKQFGIKFTFQSCLETQKQLLKVNELKNISQEIKQACFFKARRSQEAANYKTYATIQKEGFLKEQKTIHFALGQQFYTHFTSPMRRMADIIVHEMLNTIIYKQNLKEISAKEIQRINFGRTATKRLKRDLTEIYLCLMIQHQKKQFELQATVLSYGLQSISLYMPLLDSSKQIMWRSELQVDRVFRDRKKQGNDDAIRIYIHYDNKSAQKDIYWDIKKYENVKMIIDCTRQAPIRMRVKLQVKTNKGLQFIYPSSHL